MTSTAPIVGYWIREADMKKFEREATQWKRAALRLARAASKEALWLKGEPVGDAISAVARLNGGTLLTRKQGGAK